MVKELREKSGAPMMDCKNALTEAKGDIDQAFVLLRKKGMATAAKKAARTTSEGSVTSYIHAGGHGFIRSRSSGGSGSISRSLGDARGNFGGLLVVGKLSASTIESAIFEANRRIARKASSLPGIM